MVENGEKIVWSVTDVNQAAKDLLENSLMPFYLKGEVTSLLIHRSGHVYLGLKDSQSQIKATYFGGAAECRKLDLQNGDEIECFGKLSVYTVRGEYQFSIRRISKSGSGSLQQQFEALKRKLAMEGLFDSERKKRIPLLPKTVGVISSPSGAAIQDFLKIIDRRAPEMHIRLYPAIMQGEGTAASVVRAIKFFNRTRLADVLVITRGGGSMEDLWQFNSEEMARAISASEIPVISGIGHEIDFTIADFAADLRVPTPSAAAEVLSSNFINCMDFADNVKRRLSDRIELSFQRLTNRLERMERSFVFKETEHLLDAKIQHVDELENLLNTVIDRRQIEFAHKIAIMESRMNGVDPSLPLQRGYAMVFDKDKKLIRNVQQALAADEMTLRFNDGEVKVSPK
ncbi:MAG: exodeoxyribonuclease VII large subunit [Lentisphaeria bacterium]|nr:exodeoxyribonuclease VII large subunit [Lentisphaeria bacterium]